LVSIYFNSLQSAEAPEGYNSVQGVSSRHGRPSAFTDDEYVVYNIEQQQMEYLVEFRLTTSDPAYSKPGSASVTPSAALSTTTGGFSFGSSTAPAASSSFGFGGSASAAPAATTSGFSFGSSTAPAASSSFGFGATPAASSFGFGGSTSAAPATTTGGFSFGSSAAPAASSGFSFGGSTSAAPASSGFSFGSSTAPAASSFGFGGSAVPAASINITLQNGTTNTSLVVPVPSSLTLRRLRDLIETRMQIPVDEQVLHLPLSRFICWEAGAPIILTTI
jgi:hypothetical protein